MPPSLTKMYLTGMDKFANQLAGSFPRALNNLYFSDYSFNQYNLLPTGLHTLEIAVTSMTLTNAEQVAAIPSERLVNLSLTCHAYIAGNGVKHFSRELQVLKLPRVALSITDVGICDLPPSLTVLDLRSLRSLTEMAAGTLPKTLTKLKLGDSKVGEFFMKALPSGITDLLVSTSEHLPDEVVAHFPRQLKSLALPRNKSLTKDCIPHLPKTLTRVKLEDNPQFAHIDLYSHLPKIVWYFRLSASPVRPQGEYWRSRGNESYESRYVVERNAF